MNWGSDDFTKTKFVKLRDLLANPEGAIWKKRRCKKLDFFGGQI